MDIKEKNAQISFKILVLITGTIVLYPTFNEVLTPPFVFPWILITFSILALIGIVLSFIGYYINAFTTKTDHKSVGLGNFASLLSLIFFVAYFFLNLVSDNLIPPQIESISYEPINVHKGENVRIFAKINDPSSRVTEWKWQCDSSIINLRKSSEVDYLRIPKNYDKEFINVVLYLTDKENIIVKDSIQIYLQNNEYRKAKFRSFK
ncbi:hypothetical protein [Draconibacterium mangrovi]|uniref:hypothetical protein n=1 Tax=Draconibacterium mangrovi TaxID=2697469 RepID=UPI0013D30733|nr:hypothetical protein [Draconibacterium mangrovi]